MFREGRCDGDQDGPSEGACARGCPRSPSGVPFGSSPERPNARGGAGVLKSSGRGIQPTTLRLTVESLPLSYPVPQRAALLRPPALYRRAYRTGRPPASIPPRGSPWRTGARISEPCQGAASSVASHAAGGLTRHCLGRGSPSMPAGGERAGYPHRVYDSPPPRRGSLDGPVAGRRGNRPHYVTKPALLEPIPRTVLVAAVELTAPMRCTVCPGLLGPGAASRSRGIPPARARGFSSSWTEHQSRWLCDLPAGARPCTGAGPCSRAIASSSTGPMPASQRGPSTGPWMRTLVRAAGRNGRQ